MAITQPYLDAAAKRVVKINLIVEIEGISTKFSMKPITGGGSQEPSIAALKWNPPKISIDNTKVSIGTITVGLIDPNATLQTAIANGSLHLKKMTLKRGFEDIDIADYNKIAEFIIYEYSSSDGILITFKGRDRLTELQEKVVFNRTILTADLSDVATTASVEDTTGFPASGTIFIDSEKIDYSGKTATSFTGLTRGAEPAEHDEGADVHEFVTLQTNPVTMMLQMLISPGGGGPYDVLSYGLGIDQTTIDVQSFENVRDNSNLTGNIWKFEFTDDIANLLSFFEKDIFQFSNTRLFVNSDGQIACALFQEVTLDQFAGDLDQVDIQSLPNVVTNSDRVVNRIRVKFDLDPETGKFRKEAVFNETDSQANFGVIEGSTFSSRGIRAGLDGLNLAQNFSQKYFRRVAEPFGVVRDVKALWAKQFFNPGDKITFSHDKLFDLVNGTKGINNQLVEINSVKYDFITGVVTYAINNSPFLTGNRFGFISPASPIDSGTSTTVFTLKAGEVARAEWEEGWVIHIYNLDDGDTVSGPHTITDITGDQITVSPAIGFIPDNTHGMRFADYDEVAEGQKLFAFVSDGSNNFGDGGKPYVIS